MAERQDRSVPLAQVNGGRAEHPVARLSAAEPVASLYVHVPFCFHKCHYCDFYSIVDTRDRQAAYTARLIEDLRAQSRLAAGGALATIFVGGGTPSLLQADLWREVLRELHRSYDMTRIVSGGGEFTVECNPETVTAELMAVLREGGVDRVSMGAQSFNPKHLKTLERWHDPENVGKAVEMARAAGIRRQSMDLIFGIPGQTVAEWESDLRTALSMGTEHLSCYNLTYEQGTAMTKRLELGHFQPAEEAVEVEMFHATLREVRKAGMERYEVSNFARGGMSGGAVSAHNLAYWRQEQWLACGPSASGHVWAGKGGAGGGWRWKNVPRLDDYLKGSEGGLPWAVDVEGPDAERAVVERIMMGVRIAEGLDGARVAAEADAVRAGAGERVRAAARGLIAEESLVEREGRWCLTDEGWLVTNAVVLALVEAVDEEEQD